MINLAVIDLKSIIKFIIRVFVFGVIICILIFIFKQVLEYIKEKDKNVIEYQEIIDETIVSSSSSNKNDSILRKNFDLELMKVAYVCENKENDILEMSFQDEIEIAEESKIEEETKVTQVENFEIVDSQENKSEEENQIVALKTEVISKNNKTDKYTNEYNGVKIKNESKYTLTEEIMKPDVNLSNKNIIIYHTHTCESYTATETYNYAPTGNYRTTDLNFTVARVGEELATLLKKRNFNVIQDKTYHDYPAYTGSYSRSLSTINTILKNNSADFVIDLHRDALGSDGTYGPRVKIGDDICAQLMLVMGTDGGGLSHSNWKNNLKSAIKLVEIANSLYPGLFKPIILRNSRYNQHVASSACIIEVGATGNTLEEALCSMKYLSNVIEIFLK